MKKRLIDFNPEKHLSNSELFQIKGGRFRRGPDDLIDDDIDIPDLTLTPGPGDLVDDDIDIPDLTMGATWKRSFSRRFRSSMC
jgi:hypothetical protein